MSLSGTFVVCRIVLSFDSIHYKAVATTPCSKRSTGTFLRGIFPPTCSNGLDRLAVLEMSGVWWSDWGRPQRILETLRALERPTAFPEALVLEGKEIEPAVSRM
jgi:hypothetical protein